MTPTLSGSLPKAACSEFHVGCRLGLEKHPMAESGIEPETFCWVDRASTFLYLRYVKVGKFRCGWKPRQKQILTWSKASLEPAHAITAAPWPSHSRLRLRMPSREAIIKTVKFVTRSAYLPQWRELQLHSLLIQDCVCACLAERLSSDCQVSYSICLSAAVACSQGRELPYNIMLTSIIIIIIIIIITIILILLFSPNTLVF